MMFKIVIRQKGKYGDEVIHGSTESYDDAISLINLIMGICAEVDVELSLIMTNKVPKEPEQAEEKEA